MLETALTTLLRQATGLNDRVVSSTTSVLINADLPRVVYTQIDEQRRYSDDGNTGPTQARFQIDIFAATTAGAKAIARQMKRKYSAPAPNPTTSGLDGYRGTIDATIIQRVYFDSTFMQVGENVPGKNETIARCIVEALIEYFED